LPVLTSVKRSQIGGWLAFTALGTAHDGRMDILADWWRRPGAGAPRFCRCVKRIRLFKRRRRLPHIRLRQISDAGWTWQGARLTVVLIALLRFSSAVLPLLAASGRSRATVTFAVTAASLFLLLARRPRCWAERQLPAAAPLPDIGLSFTFLIDGLGLFFASIILTIGPDRRLCRLLSGRRRSGLFCFLSPVPGRDARVVLSDNILLLAIFWELTSLTSFLLIGFWHHRPEGRQGARMALIVTGSGGLALLAGMLLLGQAAGSYELSEILTRVDQVRASPLFGPILALVLAGAFTKSAQFPVHFWLPHAMAAPTPVSAYLHSATW
jgi:multicomponent K+:H+ antiporter subunit A